MESRKPLRKLRKRQNQALAKYSEAIRTDVDKLLRIKLKAIVVIEIHARDVIEKLYKLRKVFFLTIFRQHNFNQSTTNNKTIILVNAKYGRLSQFAIIYLKYGIYTENLLQPTVINRVCHNLL